TLGRRDTSYNRRYPMVDSITRYAIL
ncbi:uncharacterized protein METZ01_LOCUS451008, partial [marine metagenome]